MRERLDLTGQRFGRLTALRPAEYSRAGSAWVCRCDCGREAVVRTDNLRYGRTKSCGCKRGINPLRTGAALADETRMKRTKTRCVQKNNTSGVSGVEWLPLKNRWKATIYFKGKRYFLGHYLSFEEAVAARKRAENARKQAEAKAYNRFLRELTDTQF